MASGDGRGLAQRAPTRTNAAPVGTNSERGCLATLMSHSHNIMQAAGNEKVPESCVCARQFPALLEQHLSALQPTEQRYLAETSWLHGRNGREVLQGAVAVLVLVI